jgi:hypothetical protein
MSKAMPAVIRPHDPGERTGAPGASALVLAALFLWALSLVWRNWGTFSPDLSSLYVAGHLWSIGRIDLLYAAPEHFFGGEATVWHPYLDALGIPKGDYAFPFIYPPAWATLLAPVTQWLTLAGFHKVALILNAALVAAAIPIAHRLARGPLPLRRWTLISVLLVEAMVPSQSAIQMNQPTIIVTFLVLLAFERQTAGRPMAAGLALAAATALKLTPIGFAAFFLWRRDWRAMGWLGAGLVACLVADRLIAGKGAEALYLDALARAGASTLLCAINISVRSLIAYGWALGAGLPMTVGPNLAIFTLPPAAAHIVSALCLAASALILLSFARRLARLPTGPLAALALFILSVTLFLFGPLGWQHYYLLPTLLLPALAGLGPRTAALAAGLPVVTTGNVLLFNFLESLHVAPLPLVALAVAGWLLALALLYRLLPAPADTRAFSPPPGPFSLAPGSAMTINPGNLPAPGSPCRREPTSSRS